MQAVTAKCVVMVDPSAHKWVIGYSINPRYAFQVNLYDETVDFDAAVTQEELEVVCREACIYADMFLSQYDAVLKRG